VPSAKVDLARSLAPYLIVFDEAGQPLASSAELDGQVPPLPTGVLDRARAVGEHRVTWQPRPDVRSAAVIVHHAGPRPGFVLVGRSLREVERRVDGLTLMVGLAWAATLAGSLVAVVAAVWLGGWLVQPARQL
jgi:hypothetical protein